MDKFSEKINPYWLTEKELTEKLKIIKNDSVNEKSFLVESNLGNITQEEIDVIKEWDELERQETSK